MVKAKINGQRRSGTKVVRPLLVIMSPRDIPWIKKQYDSLDYIDTLWVKYYPTDQTVRIAKRYFLAHKQYTHLILTADDTAPDYDGIPMLVADIIKYNFPVITGCCSSDAVSGQMHLNLTFSPVTSTLKVKLFPDLYENLPPQFLGLKGIVKVWFQGNACSAMNRDAVKRAFGRTWTGRFGADLRFSYECAVQGIPQYADLRVYMEHSKYPRFGMMYGLKLQSASASKRAGEIPTRGKLIFKKATKPIPPAKPAKIIRTLPNYHRRLMNFYYDRKPRVTHLKVCLVTEFDQSGFQWRRALVAYAKREYDLLFRARKHGVFPDGFPMTVSSVVMNPSTLSVYKPNHPYWNPLKNAHVVFVYCARHSSKWEWYKLPILAKARMNKKAKLICQFDHEFIWLWHPKHVYWDTAIPWAKGKTPKEFFDETGVLKVADAYFTVMDNPPWRKFCKKPVWYMPLPQRNRYGKQMILGYKGKMKKLRSVKKSIALLQHSVKSASLTHTVINVTKKTKLPIVCFTTENLNDSNKFIKKHGLQNARIRKVYSRQPRRNYMQLLSKAWIAIDDNEGYYGWSRFAYECALVCVPCIGSTRAVKQFFPELYTKPKDYVKQRALIRQLATNVDFYRGIIVASWYRALYQLCNTRMSVRFLEKVIVGLKCPMGKLSQKQIRLLGREHFIQFLMKTIVGRHYSVPTRPAANHRVFDPLLKKIIGQAEWDREYGQWSQLILDRDVYIACRREAIRRVRGK